MTPADREKFYDDVIAPALMALGKQCQDNGLSFLATVEWERGEGGTTLSLQADRGLAIEIAAVAARSRNNVDDIIFHIMRHAKKHGHSSICLKQLGVALTPGEVSNG